ncbi:hypothetical protein FACS189428_4490 [Clostridia bacterium]|nr:hypothetical protein FACS189428_4490 [Clostridia bacterium]
MKESLLESINKSSIPNAEFTGHRNTQTGTIKKKNTITMSGRFFSQYHTQRIQLEKHHSKYNGHTVSIFNKV